MGYTYATKEFGENMARAAGVALPLSTKQCVEICNWLRGKSLSKAKEMLSSVIKMETAVPYRRFNKNVGHKKGKGIAAGRFPIKAATTLLKLLEAVEANAQYKGLNTANLVITHICSQRAARAWHYGRHRGRKMKRTSVELVVQETAAKEKKEKAEKPEQKPKQDKPAKKENKGTNNNTKTNTKSTEESKGGN